MLIHSEVKRRKPQVLNALYWLWNCQLHQASNSSYNILRVMDGYTAPTSIDNQHFILFSEQSCISFYTSIHPFIFLNFAQTYGRVCPSDNYIYIAFWIHITKPSSHILPILLTQLLTIQCIIITKWCKTHLKQPSDWFNLKSQIFNTSKP